MAVNNLLVEGIPSDRFIVLSHMTSSSDPRLGYITDTDGNSVNATWEIAWWVREPAEGMTKAGLGIYAINSDYWSSEVDYYITKKAISILNPSPIN